METFYHSEKLQSTKTPNVGIIDPPRFIIAKNYRVLKQVLGNAPVSSSFIIAKNYRVLKPILMLLYGSTRFIIAKNYRVLKPQQRS